MKTTPHTPCHCPECDTEFDTLTATPLNREESPSEGDFTFCTICGCLLRYTADLKVYRMTAHEWQALELPQRLLLICVRRRLAPLVVLQTRWEYRITQ